MRINRIQSKGSLLILLLLVITLISVFIAVCQPASNDLPQYSSESAIDESSVSELSIEDIDTFIYADESTGFTIEIPQGWTKVIKSGFPTFIHNPSATSIQIQHHDYNPLINNDTIDSLTNEIRNNGYIVNEVSFLSTSSYVYSYISEDQKTCYIVFTKWDLKDIYNVTFVVKAENYNKMFKYYEHSINSIKWDGKDSIPENYDIVFVEYGSFTFGYPLMWNVGLQDNCFIVSDPNTGSTITIRSTQNSSDYSEISKIQYGNYLSGNGSRNNFILKSYTNDGHIIHGEATYYVGNVQYGLYQYLISNGDYEIEFTLDTPVAAISETLPVFQQCLLYFKLY